MKAIWIGNFGDSKVLEIKDLARPEPHFNEVLIHLQAIGLNLIDIYMREGLQPFTLPFIPGLEASGIVEAVGNGVIGLKPGDHVAYAGTLGSYAEYNTVHASQLILLPKEISFEKGASFLFQGMAACYFLHKNQKQIKKGSRILINSAASGIGLILVQWLKFLGASVIGTVSTSSKAKVVLAAGAEQVFFYSNYDEIGKVDMIIGNASLTTPTYQLYPLKIDNYFHSTQVYRKYAYEVLNEIVAGHIDVKIKRVFSLEQVVEAQRLLGCRDTIGKIILKIN